MESLSDVLNFLGWTSESLDDIPDTQKCSINNGHLIPISRVDNHVEKCRMRLQGYTKKQIDAFWSYSDDEIQKLSETAMQSGGVKLPTDLNFDIPNTQLHQERDGMKLSEHEKAFMRDLKRRRQSYRGIHTAKKSYIEILREVIEHQTALLRDAANLDVDTNESFHGKVQSSKYPEKSSRNRSTSLDEDRSDSKLWRSSDKHSRSSNPHSHSKPRLRHSYERHSRLPHRLSNDWSYHRSERSRSRERNDRRH